MIEIEARLLLPAPGAMLMELPHMPAFSIMAHTWYVTALLFPSPISERAFPNWERIYRGNSRC